MSIVRYYNPYRNARRMRLADQFFGDYNRMATTVSPAVDIAENEDEYIFELALPGFTGEEVSVTATSDELTIEAAKLVEKEESSDEESTETAVEETNGSNGGLRYIRKERRQAAYKRSFSFNRPINPSEAKVTLENGILTVSVAKAEETKPVKLAIN